MGRDRRGPARDGGRRKGDITVTRDTRKPNIVQRCQHPNRTMVPMYMSLLLLQIQ